MSASKARRARRTHLNWLGDTVESIPVITSLAPFPTMATGTIPVQEEWCKDWKVKEEKKKEHTMYATCNVIANAPTPTEETQRKYLCERLNEVNCDKYEEIEKTYNICDMDPPNTRKELADRLSKGLFVIDDLDKAPDKTFCYHNWREVFRWRDPAKPADEAGSEKAIAARNALYQTTLDTIVIKTPQEGLDAVKTFETTTF